MDILEDLRTTTFSNNEAFFKKAACEIEQLRTENAALKEQVAYLEELNRKLCDKANQLTIMDARAGETIAQQALVIEQMREALKEVVDLIGESSGVYGLHLNGDVAPWEEIEQGGRFDRLTLLPKAIALQPSPEILQARDERVAEACAKVAAPKVGIRYDDYNLTIRNGTVKALRSGEWRKYL